jgi:integral membrane protein
VVALVPGRDHRWATVGDVSEDVSGEREVAPGTEGALLRYRIAATVVGVLLIVLCLVGLPLNEAHRVDLAWFPLGSSAQQVGAAISQYLGVAHGYLYMLFVVLAFLLSRKARWDLGFTLVTLLCGTVPVLSFWAERRATRRVREQLAASTGSSYAAQR